MLFRLSVNDFASSLVSLVTPQQDVYSDISNVVVYAKG